jgi:hypothetical protein
MTEQTDMVRMLARRNRCVIPEGTVVAYLSVSVGLFTWGGREGSGSPVGGSRTVAVVVQVEELVVPLCYYSDDVLDEGYDDEEAADGWQVTVSNANLSTDGVQSSFRKWSSSGVRTA